MTLVLLPLVTLVVNEHSDHSGLQHETLTGVKGQWNTDDIIGARSDAFMVDWVNVWLVTRQRRAPSVFTIVNTASH